MHAAARASRPGGGGKPARGRGAARQGPARPGEARRARRARCHDLAKLELVQDGGLAGSVEADHEDAHILLAKELGEHLGEGETHGCSGVWLLFSWDVARGEGRTWSAAGQACAIRYSRIGTAQAMWRGAGRGGERWRARALGALHLTARRPRRGGVGGARKARPQRRAHWAPWAHLGFFQERARRESGKNADAITRHAHVSGAC